MVTSRTYVQDLMVTSALKKKNLTTVQRTNKDLQSLMRRGVGNYLGISWNG